jgi:hypothetical protein
MGKITVVTAGPDNDLASFPMVKAYMGLQADTSNDDVLKHLLSSASAFIENYCGRRFAKQKVIEDTAGSGLPDMLVSVTPILGVEAVYLDEAAYTDYIVANPEAGILQRRGSWSYTGFNSFYLNDAPSNYAEDRWHFHYTGGYVLPGWVGKDDTFYTGGGTTPKFIRTLPYDLERACIDIVRSQLKQIQTGADPAMTTYKIGETMAQWKQDVDFLGGDMAAMGIPASAIGTLQHYRRAY